MSEVAQETQQEFWRPPSPVVADELVVREAIPTMAEACPRCGTEFLLGSRFCHTCGGRRPEAISPAAQADAAAMAGLWEQGVARVYSLVAGLSSGWSKIKFPSWLRYLHFHEIKSWVGLSTAIAHRIRDRRGLRRGSLAGRTAHGQDFCGLAGHPVLPRGMAAGGHRRVCGGNSAEETFQPRIIPDYDPGRSSRPSLTRR